MRAMMAAQTQEQFRVRSSAFLRTMIRDEHDLAFVSKTSSLSDPATTGQAMCELLTTELRSETGKITEPALLFGA